MRGLSFTLVALAFAAVAHADGNPPDPLADDHPPLPPGYVKIPPPASDNDPPFDGALFAGASVRGFYSVPVVGLAAQLQMGAQKPRYAITGLFDLFWGAAQFGLRSYAVRFGVLAEVKLGRWRVGPGLTLGIVDISAPRKDTGNSPTLALLIAASFDIVSWRHQEGALFVGARVGADIVAVGGGSTTAAYYGTLGLGTRF